jgi:hypothetical protein
MQNERRDARFFFSFFLCVFGDGGTGVWIEILVLARQALYPLSHSAKAVCQTFILLLVTLYV